MKNKSKTSKTRLEDLIPSQILGFQKIEQDEDGFGATATYAVSRTYQLQVNAVAWDAYCNHVTYSLMLKKIGCSSYELCKSISLDNLENCARRLLTQKSKELTTSARESLSLAEELAEVLEKL